MTLTVVGWVVFMQSMISGFLAAVVGPVATGPFDVAKTRMMAQEKGVSPANAARASTRAGVFCVKQALRQQPTAVTVVSSIR